jgi:DNA-binding SARP family transcriptional activator
MIALATVGQRDAALDLFTGLRHRLDAELGIRPSTVLVHARRQVLGRGRVR